jgi:AAA+ ATPase superfamily predicted ATPase
MTQLLGRQAELALIGEFLNQNGSGLTYLRGRRRIGKSLLLKHVQNQHPHAFYFVGLQDSTTRATLRLFAEKWDQFCGDTELTDISSSKLNWERVFTAITRKARVSKIVLLFDEIQWIAKERSGFMGLLKVAWEDWKSTGNVKLVLCGSSNNFFFKKTGGEEKILRGLKTFAEIWVRPFSLKEVKQYYFPEWTHEQVCLLYMMVGGIPYYLEQFVDRKNFIRSINKTLFTQSSIFLDEMQEVLKLEFKSRGLEKAAAVLSVLGVQGTTEAQVVKKTGLAQSTAHEVLDTLVDYDLIEARNKLPAVKKQNDAGIRYHSTDFFLNFYFSVLQPMQHQIRANRDALLFPYHCLGSQSGYYIPGYSGECFELLVLETLRRRELHIPIMQKLRLLDQNFEVGTYWKDKETQVDIVVEHAGDRESRILECKWVNHSLALSSNLLAALLNKKYPAPKDYRTRYFLLSSQTLSAGLLQALREQSVEIFSLEDLF